MENIFIENPTLFYILVGALMLWMLPWKAWALWRSARNGQKWWFLAILLINSLALLEILYIFIFSKNKSQEVEPISTPKQTDITSKHNMQKPRMVL